MPTRALFWDEDDARGVAARLVGEGFTVQVAREPFAGEDDDEDHPWAVSTDAPDATLEILAEERDGWVDHEPSPMTPAQRSVGRLDLPSAPRRHHRDPRAADGDSPAGS